MCQMGSISQVFWGMFFFRIMGNVFEFFLSLVTNFNLYFKAKIMPGAFMNIHERLVQYI